MITFDTLFFKYLTLADSDANEALQKGRRALIQGKS